MKDARKRGEGEAGRKAEEKQGMYRETRIVDGTVEGCPDETVIRVNRRRNVGRGVEGLRDSGVVGTFRLEMRSPAGKLGIPTFNLFL